MAEEEKEEDLLQDAEALTEALSPEGGETAEGDVDPLAEEMLKAMESGEGEGGEDVGEMMEAEMLKAMEQEGGGEDAEGLEGLEGLAAPAPAKPAPGPGVSPNIARLMDVKLMVTIELGRTKRTVQEVLDMAEQTLIELDRTVGEPVEVRVNGKLFARGEVVTVSENFGVRITELVSPLSAAL